jgi:putative oxidoreductase
MALPALLLAPTIIVEVLGGLGVLLGLGTRWSALALAGFCLLAAAVFHLDLSDRTQMITFLENVAMAGGLLVLAGAGPGAFALDNRLRG